MGENKEKLNEKKAKEFFMPKKSNCGRVSYPIGLTKMLKEYDKELLHKLPNELRGALKNNYSGACDYHLNEFIHGFF